MKENKSEKSNKTTTDVSKLPKAAQRVVKRSWQRTLLIVLLVIAFATLLFFAFRYLSNVKNPPVATIDGETVTRMGNSQTLTFEGEGIKRGETVCWFVNGKRVSCQRYNGKPLTYKYNPTRIGTDHVRVEVSGKVYKSLNINVGKRLATVTVGNYSAVYGNLLPQFDYTVEGVDKSLLGNCKVYLDETPTDVGIYKLRLDCADCEGCDVEVINGTLEITPRPLTVTNTFVKQYDGTNCMQVDLMLDGKLNDDDVYCKDVTVCFNDKNVGSKQVFITNAVLQGADAKNYCLETAEWEGEITPKTLTVQGTEIACKNYDGTNKATFKSVGKLVGVVDGDVVGIGSCSACFDDCKVGKNKKVTVSNVTLVGKDKDNYCLDCTFDCTANIEKNYKDILLDGPKVIHGQTK